MFDSNIQKRLFTRIYSKGLLIILDYIRVMREILFEWNPWWNQTYHFEKIKRDLFEDIRRWIDRKEIISILGVRRSGKTTLLYETIDYLIHQKKIDPNNIFFIKADDERIEKENFINTMLEEYMVWKNPKGKIYVFIDEIQEIEGWEKTLKRIYDLECERKKIFISGSNASLLKEELSYLLTGRCAYFELFPFNYKEYLRSQKIELHDEMDTISQKTSLRNKLISYIEYGGFPEIVLEKNEERKEELLRFYFESILYRDIVKRKKIRNVEKLDRMVKWYLQNISAYANYEKLGKFSNLSTDTIGEYTRFLQDAYLIFPINILAYSIKKQYINPKKIYVIDSGIRRIIGFTFSQDVGRIYENIVYIHLKQKQYEIFYWKNKNECDFIVKDKEKIKSAIQVTHNLNQSKTREIQGLIEAMEEFNLQQGTIITENYEGKESIDKKTINFIPLWKWLLQ